MSYEKFAYIYDYLMKDVPYDSWVDFVIHQASENDVKGKQLLDIACGTGELSLKLVEQGFHVTGVDLSEDMLHIANDKSIEKGVELSLFQQDMSELNGLGEYDIITIFCDSLNYLETEDDVKRTFECVRQHLKKGGLFMFDIHSIYKMSQIFMNQTFTYNDTQVSYIWDCFPGNGANSVEHELTFFVRQSSGRLYERVEELHKQRTYPINTVRQWLEDAGYSIMSITSDFDLLPPSDRSERIFFTLKRN
ncbi:putative TPR repeat methyltransferase [Bacillus pakistanensis]|uniref:TPR repeat methyltransferase n=1 Tax=Rossellomorea pakistanensis TaxID=992288 RepID=A0ABS2NA69_9BACI|nr:class I SAM-dependent methyltransferase [Bacillus pakistanensis]MBM7584752.1 putative TPR repeat methyltransferase [Bacillus pakistanensis]